MMLIDSILRAGEKTANESVGQSLIQFGYWLFQ